MLAIDDGLPQPLIDELTAALPSNLMPAGVALTFSADDVAGDQILAEALEVVAAQSGSRCTRASHLKLLGRASAVLARAWTTSCGPSIAGRP